MGTHIMYEEKSMIVFVTVKIPYDKECEAPLSAKTFSSERKRFYAHILSTVHSDRIYREQIQI